MACSALSSLNFVAPVVPSSALTISVPTKHFLFFSDSLHSATRSKLAPPPRVASLPVPPMNADYLAGEFSGRGVAFEAVGDDCVAKLSLDDGSSAILMLPCGMVTSYKAPMWHGAKMELLQTVVSEGEDDGAAEVRGGVCVDVSVEREDGEGGRVSWRPRDWAVRDVRGNSEDSVQVELISRDLKGMVDVRHVLTLQEQVLSTEVEVSNSGTTPVQLRGSILSHLKVSTPDATYAIGLEGSDFFKRPPFSSNFRIVPPEVDQKGNLGLAKLWEKFRPQGLAYAIDYEKEDKMEDEEDDNYKQLTDEMSLIYTSAPTNLTIIDRGRRNSVVVGRNGYDELYLYSPGSQHEHYGKYAYICVGQSALLKPVAIGPGEVWRGGQHLHNPNV